MVMDLPAFVAESNRIEGINTISQAEVDATERFLAVLTPTISHLVDLVRVYQPNAVPRFSAGLDVRVGQHVPPRGGPAIHAELASLLQQVRSGLSPYQGHLHYETLHPFTDGNGRSGRALWLWSMGGIDRAPLGFLHHFYYQALQESRV